MRVLYYAFEVPVIILKRGWHVRLFSTPAETSAGGLIGYFRPQLLLMFLF